MIYHSYQVSNAPPTASTDIFTSMQDFTKQHVLGLGLAGILGLISQPMFKFQSGEPFKTIRIAASILFIGLGVMGFASNGGQFTF